MNDGVGNPKNTKSMLLAHRTPPAMAEGVRMSAEEAVRSGITHILFCRPARRGGGRDRRVSQVAPAGAQSAPGRRPAESGGRAGPASCSRASGSAARGAIRRRSTPTCKSHNVGTRSRERVHRPLRHAHAGRSLADGPLPARRPLRDAQGIARRRQARPASRPQRPGLSEREIDDLVEFVLSL